MAGLLQENCAPAAHAIGRADRLRRPGPEGAPRGGICAKVKPERQGLRSSRCSVWEL